MTLTVSLGQHRADASPARFAAEFPALVEWLKARTPTAGDKDGPYLVFADFGEGGTRDYDHLLASYAVPLDLDLGKFTWNADAIRARFPGRQFIAWTSYSHTPERPRWRVVVPLERGATREEHYATWDTLAELFARDCGESSKDATRLNYIPGAAAHPEHAQFIYGEGAPFPVSAVPEGTAVQAGDQWSDEPVEGYTGTSDDDELIAHMLAARSRSQDAFAPPGTPTKFAALWNADAAHLVSLFPPQEDGQQFDHTRADAALANELVYYTGGDCERALRIMERGTLAQRDTWEERKGRLAISLALKGRAAFAYIRKTPAEPTVPEGTLETADPYASRIDRTDAGNANLLIRLAQGTLRLVTETAKWLYWNARRWQIDTHEVFVSTRALEVAKHYLAEAERADKDSRLDLRTDYTKWAAKCRNRSTLDNMIVLARKSPGVAISVTQLDRNPWLLGVENGVVDLRTGELHEDESRDEYVTKRCAVRYDPAATAPRWEQFIAEITGTHVLDEQGEIVPGTTDQYVPRPAMARYLQKALGYSITGSTAEQILFIAIGKGSNGKNVAFDLMKRLLGDYAQIMPPDALMASARPADAERATSVAAKLAGARFVLSSETKDGQTLDVGLIKNHTGDAEMTARRLYEDAFTFAITHKLWISTNNKPNLSQVDPAIRGRLHLIPFARRWNRPAESERDPLLPDGDKTLPDKLAAEIEGVLAWLVRGAVLYQREGLTPPAEVKAATGDYIAKQDSLSRWFETMERCEPAQGTAAATLFLQFKAWCVEEGMQAKPDNQTAFGLALKDKNVDKKSVAASNKYGLRARS
ncbi:MAG: phage/plasmid primase, P4 family [Pseudomonadota bacterium]